MLSSVAVCFGQASVFSGAAPSVSYQRYPLTITKTYKNILKLFLVSLIHGERNVKQMCVCRWTTLEQEPDVLELNLVSLTQVVCLAKHAGSLEQPTPWDTT